MPSLWPFRPLLGCTETLEWRTDMLGGYTGEQRIAERSAPRQNFEYSHRLQAEQLSRAKAFARANSTAKVYVPVWGEEVVLTAPVASADTSLSFDATWGDYRVGSFLMVWESDANHAVVEIATVADDGVTLADAVGIDATVASVAPVRIAWAMEGYNFDRNTVLHDAGAKFLVADNIDLAADYVTAYPQYQSLDVMTDRTVIIDSVAENILRAAQYHDNGFGPVEIEPMRNYDEYGQTVGFWTERGAPLWQRRLWLHALRGKQKTFWLPSFNRDLEIQATIGSSDTAVLVTSVGAAASYINRHVRILLNSGTEYYRQITNAVSAGGGNDTLTISSSLGAAVTAADILEFSFISKVRLNSDNVRIEHRFWNNSLITIPVMEVPA